MTNHRFFQERSNFWNGVGLFLVFLSVFWAYFPSLFHIPRHDQVAYWAETASKTDFFSLTFGAYSLNRGRVFNPGDELLFRPFLYLFLGLEKWLLGHAFMLWQLAGVILHIICVWRLWRLLRSIEQSSFALYLTALFALLFVNIEMVIWQNINAYMIACILFLFAFERVVIFLKSDQEKISGLRMAVAALVCASLFYEAAALFALCFYLRFKFLGGGAGRVSWWFLMPLLVLCAGSAVDMAVRDVPAVSLQAFAGTGGVLHSIKMYLTAVKWTVITGVFSWAGDVFVFFRTVLHPRTYSWAWPFDAFSWTLCPGLFLIAGYTWVQSAAYFTGQGRSPTLKEPVKGNIVWLALICLLAFWGLISLGRMNSRGVMVGLGINLYYQYVVWLLLVILLYASVDFKAFQTHSRLRYVRTFARCAIIIFVFWNALSLRIYNSRMAEWQRPTRQLLIIVDDLVRQHRNEEGFSFYVDPQVPGNIMDPWLRKGHDLPGRKYSIVQALYWKDFNPDKPLYTISVSANVEK